MPSGLPPAVMTCLILLFGEIFPKSLATRNNLLIARLVIHPIWWCAIVFWPVTRVLGFIPSLTGRMERLPTVTEEELITIVEVGEEEGEIKEEEKEFIRNIFEFDDISASEIMTPRRDMFFLDIEDALDLEAVLESGFSRIPVIEGTVDNIIGIVFVADLFRFPAQGKAIPPLKDVLRKVHFVPENKKIDTLLAQFKKTKQHMAIVVDEHGGVEGVVTMEDVLEEIVGDIADETDVVEELVVETGPMEWRILGKAAIDEVNEVLPSPFEESPDYDTFSGLILDRLGRFPASGEKIRIVDYLVTVEEMEGNRILALRVFWEQRPDPVMEEEEQSA